MRDFANSRDGKLIIPDLRRFGIMMPWWKWWLSWKILIARGIERWQSHFLNGLKKIFVFHCGTMLITPCLPFCHLMTEISFRYVFLTKIMKSAFFYLQLNSTITDLPPNLWLFWRQSAQEFFNKEKKKDVFCCKRKKISISRFWCMEKI